MNPGLNIFKRAQRLQGGIGEVRGKEPPFAEGGKWWWEKQDEQAKLDAQQAAGHDLTPAQIASGAIGGSYKTIGVEIDGKEVEIPMWQGQTPEGAEDMARMRLEWNLDPFATDEELEAVQNAAHMGPDDATMDPESPNYTGRPGYAGGTGNVMDLERGNWPVSEEELRTLPDWLAHLLRGIPEKPGKGSQRDQFSPRSVPVMQGPQGRFYDPRYSADDERIMAKEGNADIEPLKLAGGSGFVPGGWTFYHPGGGGVEGGLQGNVDNPLNPYSGEPGTRGMPISLAFPPGKEHLQGQLHWVGGPFGWGRYEDTGSGVHGHGDIAVRGKYKSLARTGWNPRLFRGGGGGQGGTIPGGPFKGWTPEAMNQWHSGAPPSQMGYPSFTGNTAGPGGQQLAFETTSYNIPGYGWVPRAQLANAQASNNPLDYLNPFGGTSKGGSNTGDPTQRGVGMVVGTASNLVLPGLGFITGPLARWATNLIQHGWSKQQVAQAVAVKQNQTPAMAAPQPAPAPAQGSGTDPWGNPDTGDRWSNDFGRGLGGPSLSSAGGTKFGQFGTGFGTGTVGNFNTAIGFGGSYGGGSNAGDTSRFMSGAGYNRPYTAEQWANMPGAKKYPSPVLAGAWGGATPQASYEQYLQMFHPVGSLGSSTGYGGAAYSGGGPKGIGGGIPTLKPSGQKAFAMGTSDVNPGLKIFHQTQLKRKKP